MAKSKQEKLQNILEQIAKENMSISQSKERLKKLNAQKKKLEKQLQEEESARLMNVLADYGIKNIDDFEKFIDNSDFLKYTNPAQPTEE